MDWHDDADIYWRADYRDPLEGQTVAFDGSWLHIRAGDGVVHTVPMDEVEQVTWWEHGRPDGDEVPEIKPFFIR